MREDHELYKFRKRGLDFLISWTEPSNLKQLADFALNGQRGFLDNFRPMNNSVRRLLRAQPRVLLGIGYLVTFQFLACWLSFKELLQKM